MAIPFLRPSATTLFTVTAPGAAAAPVLRHPPRPAPPPAAELGPGFADPVAAPGATAAQLLLTGACPALPYLTCLLAGPAIGRLHLAVVGWLTR